MSQYIIQRETLTGLADNIRALSRTDDELSLDNMTVKLQEQKANVDAALAALVEVGVNVPEGSGADALAELITNVGSSGGNGEAAEWSENEDAIITKGISGVYMNDRVNTIGSYAFEYCSDLTSVSFPVCTTISYQAFGFCSGLTSVSFPVCKIIDYQAFCYCSGLTSVNFPACKIIGNQAFCNCYNLTSVNFPACTTISYLAFYYCHNLTSVSFPACTIIGSTAFSNCYKLSALTLGASTVCKLSKSDAFRSTPFADYNYYFSGTPHIYVPASLVSAYKSATNWTYFSSYFSSIESLEGGSNEGSGEDPDNSGGEGNLITFAINGIEQKAEEGMTWEEWIETEHNTLGIHLDTFSRVLDANGNEISDRAGLGTGQPVKSTDVIIPDYDYIC